MSQEISTSISVIIPTYNRAHCIVKAIDSVIKQSYQPKELIIVDDGSSDNLHKIIDKYDVDYIKLIRHKYNQGASQSRNTGIKEAKYEYIAFLDSDDVWHPKKLEIQLHFMQQHNFDACCTNFTLYNNGVLEQELAYRPYNTNRLSQKEIAWGCFIAPGSTFICKKDLLIAVNSYDLSLKRCEDWDLLLRLSQHSDIGWLNKSFSNIYVEHHITDQSELFSLTLIKRKFFGKDLPMQIKRTILSSYCFQKSSINFKHKRYIYFVLYIFLCFIIRPFNNFPIKAIFIPKIKKLLFRCRTTGII